MLVRKATLERERARAVEIEARLQAELGRANAARKKWRGGFLEQVAHRRKIEGELAAAIERAKAAEAAYYGLVSKMLTPPTAPPPLEPVDPEIASLDRISSETVERMAEQFVRDGLSPDLAKEHAQEIVSLAERAWGGAPGTV